MHDVWTDRQVVNVDMRNGIDGGEEGTIGGEMDKRRGVTKESGARWRREAVAGGGTGGRGSVVAVCLVGETCRRTRYGQLSVFGKN